MVVTALAPAAAVVDGRGGGWASAGSDQPSIKSTMKSQSRCPRPALTAFCLPLGRDDGGAVGGVVTDAHFSFSFFWLPRRLLATSCDPFRLNHRGFTCVYLPLLFLSYMIHPPASQ